MREIDNERGGFEDWDGNKVEFGLSNFEARRAMIADPNFSYDHYNLNDGVVTVAAGRIGNKLYCSMAFCAPEDNFSRRYGRSLAALHFLNDDCSHRRAIVDVSEVKDEPPSIVLLHALMEYLKRGKSVPQWARNPVVSFRNRPRV